MRKNIYILVLLITTISFGQRKYAADRYFKEFAYKKAAELYQSIHKKGDDSYLVLSRLADAHYFNFEFAKAEKNYEKLMSLYEESVLVEHLFRYAQVLKTNGKITESDKWLLKLSGKKRNDSRAEALVKNKNYFTEYTKEKKVFVNINNLSINTKYSDFGGFVFNDDFYFASTKPDGANDKRLYKWNNQPHLNIYKAKEVFKTEEKVLDVEDQVKVVSVSSKYHESNAIITSNGNTMYFTRTNFDGKKLKGGDDEIAHLKIYKTEKVGEVWGEAIELPFNNDNYSVGHPALSVDEKVLYFVSDMPNGFGLTDVYKVNILENNAFSTPENLGKSINTEGREMFPFIDSKETLYFASDGHLGLGALDVFEAKKEGDTYTKPVNLGAPINGAYDDFSFIINNNRNNGFFSSNRKKGKGDDDIYSFIVYSCKEDVSGVVYEAKTNKPLNDVTVKLISEEGEVVAEKVTNKDGSYSFELVDCEKNFTVTASKIDYKEDQKSAKTLDVNKQLITQNLKLEPLIVENQIVINPIYFDFDKYNIRKDAEYELEHIVSVMKNNSKMIIKIESHTDSRGTKEYNKRLSTNRAISTKDYIISRGISSDRIESALGFGESQLLNNCDDASNCSKEEHQKNRRSYFYILKK
ncbi:OmpA family protein [Tenacibaculum ovolyticum]|uniref:OmpA family protein n=1 Tax=Tenacibaculum ovolyticum TaxID=104270 RepID=UPI000428627B|nr:OmpA family protein [Tenacibaculum ovolyticum]